MRVTPPGEPDGNQYAGARGRSGLALLSGIEAERLIVSELLPNTGHDLAEARCIAALVARSPSSLNAFMQERKEISLPQRPLPANIIRQLLHFAVDDEFNKTETAKRLGIARSSATKYIKAFDSSTLTLTDLENVGSAKLAKITFPKQ